MYKIMFTALFLFPMLSYGAVFKCVVDGSITFQGIPCQQGVGEKLELDISPSTSVVKAPAVSSGRDNSRSSSKKNKLNLRKINKKKQRALRRCEKARARYKRHLSIMRAGYSHKKSNRMGEKARLLKAEINNRCS